jgi:DNA adenine methylase
MTALRPTTPSLKARPVVKWAGGKSQLLKHIIDRLPAGLTSDEIDTYHEPFLGGGAVFLHLLQHYPLRKAYLSDLNPDLIGLYLTIRQDCEALIVRLQYLEEAYLAKQDDARKAEFYRLRTLYNTGESASRVERSALLLLLNRSCYNGLFRVNRKGEFNVPYGRYKNPRILDTTNLRQVSTLLQRAEIHCTDFSTVLETATERSFIYYDPPYRPLSKTASFNAYARGGFGDAEQARLAEVFREADARGAKQMLSNSDPTNHAAEDDFFDRLYAGYHICRIEASRFINSRAAMRGKVREILVTNYAT